MTLKAQTSPTLDTQLRSDHFNDEHVVRSSLHYEFHGAPEFSESFTRGMVADRRLSQT